ncbi:MAG TPA: thioredoxin-dependent thiol peroxidase [Candidatus Doudnabacteria bacterium]|nr:thioredoxin-dependent thiol peroxidase [Candidatus Doudnabacteria bacterium]
MAPQIGSTAPNFSLPDQDGQKHKLTDYKGRWVLLYFYPKDDTPGCTTEACAMRDNLPKFGKLQAKVFGISVDSVASHKKFAEKHRLNFTLLADEDKAVVTKYGVWQEKSMYGRKYLGTVRNSFLISPQGKIAKIYRKVKPEQHAAEVLADINELSI